MSIRAEKKGMDVALQENMDAKRAARADIDLECMNWVEKVAGVQYVLHVLYINLLKY